MYSATLLDHFRSPRNAGMMRHPDAVGEWEDGHCGDLARFYLRVAEGRIAEARFQTYGCGPSIAASSLLTELVRGWTMEAVQRLTPERVEDALGGLPEERRHAAPLVVHALQTAVARYGGGPSSEGPGA